MSYSWSSIEAKALKNQPITKREALEVLTALDEDVMSIVASASHVRQKFYGKRVKLNYLVNVKSGLCPEDCHYCTQSKDSEAPIDKYSLMSADEIIHHTERGMQSGAMRACLVASGRGPSNKELGEFCGAVEELKKKHPQMEVCACLGLLNDGQAEKLKNSGVYAYNHNINTSEAHYDKICKTHNYQDRLDTVEKAQVGGLSSCSGVLVGMGESDDDLVDMAFSLRAKNVNSIPVNFLVSVDKTPMANVQNLTPMRALKILALFRFVNPMPELRIAAGREVHLRHLQPLGLMIANSIFIGDYLTTKGQSSRSDLEMIRDLGYEIEGQSPDFLAKILGTPRHDADLKESQKLEPTLP